MSNPEIFESKLEKLDARLNERVKRKKLSQSEKDKLFTKEYAAFNKAHGIHRGLSIEMIEHKKKIGTMPWDVWFKRMCEIRAKEEGAMTVGQFLSLKKSLQKEKV